MEERGGGEVEEEELKRGLKSELQDGGRRKKGWKIESGR